MRYVVVLEQGENGICAYVPDLPGCVAVGETKEETLRPLGEAVELHLQALRKGIGNQSPSFRRAASMLR